MRTVVHLSSENYIYVHQKLTPEGEHKPPFGYISQYFNGLVEAARVREILKTEGKEQPK